MPLAPSTIRRACDVGFRMGRLAGSEYFHPDDGPWGDEQGLVAWGKRKIDPRPNPIDRG
jgi:hypothetical protein